MLNKPLGENVRVVIAANQISLTKEKSVQSSMLNNLAVTIEAIDGFNSYSKLVRLRIKDNPLPLLAQITKRSVKHLNLQPNQHWVAAIKTVSIL
jgi:molybdate transport system ATP-binding protein